MRCRKAQKRIALFVGGDATYCESESVKEHLIRCDVCATEHDSYAKSQRTLRMLRDRKAPSWIWEGFNQGVFRRIRETKSINTAPRKRRAHFAYTGTALAAAAVIMLMFLFAWPFIRVEQAAPAFDRPGMTQTNGGTPRGYVLPSATGEQQQPLHEREWFNPLDSSRSQEI